MFRRYLRPIILAAAVALAVFGAMIATGRGEETASTLQTVTENIVHGVGCNAQVVVTDQGKLYQSYYDFEDDILVIGTGRTPSWQTYLMVVLHETGHCMQGQKYGDRILALYPRDPMMFEIDADYFAVETACALDLDGPGLWRDALGWVYSLGYRGDEEHGTIWQRLSVAEHAKCPVKQAPVRS